MGYTYVLLVEEDLAKLGIPEATEEEVAAAWVAQGGEGDPPAELVPHIGEALMRIWLETHREARLAELDATRRWAADNLGWRPLLHDLTVTEILEEQGSAGLHRELYSDRPDKWFDSRRVRELAALVRSHPRYTELSDHVRAELDAFDRALDVMVRYGLRFRFDYCP